MTESESMQASRDVDPGFVDKPDIEKENADDSQQMPYSGYEPSDFYENLAPYLGTNEHDALSHKYTRLYESDKTAREKRDKLYEDGIRRTGISGDAPGGADFQGASKAVHPGLMEACIDFCARTMKELFPPDGPVRMKIDGKLTSDKADKAERKVRHMNWQLTEQVPEYRGVLEQVLTQLPLGGSQFIKFYPDFLRKRPCCELVRIDNVYLPYGCQDFYSAQRVAHYQRLSQYEFDRRVKAGIYDDTERTPPATDAPKTKTQEQLDKAEGVEAPSDDENLRGIIEYYIYDDVDYDQGSGGEVEAGDTDYRRESGDSGDIADDESADDDTTEEEKPRRKSKSKGRANPDLGPAPYILTIDEASGVILGLYRNWEEDSPAQNKLDWMIKWGFIPWEGALEIGLPHIIGTLSGAATGALRALLDSALIQNIPTAVTMKGTSISGQSKRIGPTQVVEIQSRQPGIDDIRKIFQQLPFNPPSAVLMELLAFVDGQMRGVVRTTLDQQSEDNQNMPVGTKLANIEQGMVVYSSIHQRLHAAQARCLSVLHRINRMYMDDKPYDEDLGFAVRMDYEGEIDVQPVSDPNIFSETQRYGQLQAVFQLNQLFPGLYDPRALNKWALTMMRIPNTDEIMPDPQHPKDENPVTENIMMSLGQQAIALPDQDHLAHLQVLLDFVQSPMLGANPMIVQKFLPLAAAHAAQHYLYLYGDLMRLRVEQALGVPLKEVQDEDPVVAKKFQQTVAAASPMVVGEMPQILAKAQQIMLQVQEQVNQMMQSQQQMNPMMIESQVAQAQIQDKAQQTAIKAKQVDADIAGKSQDVALRAKETEARIADSSQQTALQAKDAETQAQLKAQELAERTMADQQKIAVEDKKARIDLLKNEEDNRTALEIASMRVLSGHGTGGLKDGGSLGE